MSEERDHFIPVGERLSTLEEKASVFAKTLEEIHADVKVLRAESAQWSGVRRTLGILVTLITLAGAFIGYVTHYLWPLGFSDRGH